MSAAACRVVSLFNTKGGVGKTIVATALASALEGLLHRSTAFLSLEPAKDDTAEMLGNSPVHRVKEAITAEGLPGIIDVLRQRFAYVVIDAGSVFNELAVTAFEHSHMILLVTTPDVVAIRHTLRAIDQLVALRFPLPMIKVAINRAESHGNIHSRELRERFPIEVVAEIPSDGRLVSLAVNRSMPLMLSGNSTRIQDAFRRLARTLTDSPSLFVEHLAIDHTKLPAVPAELAPGASTEAPAEALPSDEDPVLALKRRIRSNLIERFDLKRIDLQTLNDPLKAKQLRERTEQVALELLVEEKGFPVSREERERLVKEIVDDTLGLGPLEDLMADQEISDILINGKDKIYVERRGRLSLTDKRFISNDQVLTVIDRIIAPLGRRIDESVPMVDARLPDGSRINAIIQPLSIRGPMVSIRKFSRERLTMEDLIRLGTLNAPMAQFLNAAVRARKNIIVSGGTGSGKTTMLNVLSAAIPEEERILTIEDAAELRLGQEHWVPLETRQPNVEGRGAVTVRHLFRNALRMRPDRILIGECRGDETLDMLQAMNTGHDGSLTTLHANSPEDVIARLDSLVLMGNVDLPVRAVREQIASAVHLVVHISRFSDGTRKVTHIDEITGIDDRGEEITFRELFLFRQRGLGPKGEVLGEFTATGQAPTFLAEVAARGIPLDPAIFQSAHGDHPEPHVQHHSG